jgi:hypothetical protein
MFTETKNNFSDHWRGERWFKWAFRVLIIGFILSLIFGLMGTGIIPTVRGSDVSGAQWIGTVQVTNNSTATTAVSTNFSLSSAGLISGGYTNSSLTDTSIQYNGTDTVFMPGFGTASWAIFISTIGQSQNLNYNLYAKGVTGGKIRYFPGPTGMITADSPTLEPSANFTQEHKGYFDVSASAVGANIAYKPQAIRTFVGSTGNITSIIYNTDQFNTDTWTDTGAKIRVNGGRLEYESERSATDDRSYKDYGIQDNTLWELDWTWYPTSSSNASGAGSALVYFGLFDNTANPNGYATDFLSFLGTLQGTGEYYAYIKACDASAQTQSTSITYTPATTYYVSLRRESAILASLSIYSDVARTTHIAGSPKTLAIPATLINLRYLQCTNLNNNLGATIEAIGWIDDLSPSWTRPTVSATGLSSGEHTIMAGLAGGTFGISIDGGALVTTAYAGSVPDNPNNWTDCESAAMPYVESVKRWENGVLQQHIYWEYNTVFSDHSGATPSHPATPSFRATSSDADVSAELIIFSPLTEAKSTATANYGTPTILTTTPTAPPQLYTEGNYGGIPGADAANAMLDAGDVPRALWWFPFIFIGIAICGLLSYGASRLKGGTGTLWMPVITIETLFVLFGLLNPIAFFPAIIFPITAITILTADKHNSMG